MAPSRSPRPGPRALLAGSIALLLAVAGVAAACSSSDDSSADTVPLTGDAAKGQEVVRDLGCTTCHTVDGGDGVGPTFKGLAGSTVTLEGGDEVTADEDYLRTAITDPGEQVVEGFTPIMPERDLSDTQVDQVVAYLQALGSKG
ncbi:c-type cytochrome [Dermatobacter hominis]|uniref:c-type cytochrome n=1 Tax=Dermatobacter hominis TaxID=2884263 RepID=UPI001D0FD1DF|nr:c-type cytochrome [Dermatobacter hominis]UDY34615.1 cytochrome c [Dermatobacter hominis]